MSKEITITGDIDNLTFRNSEGWSVFTLIEQGGNLLQTSCTGNLPASCDVGTEITVTGKWETNKYGTQLKCSQIVPAPPDTDSSAGVTKLLQRLPGIGIKRAQEAVRVHGHEKAWQYALTTPVTIGVPAAYAEQAAETARSLVTDFKTLSYLLGIGLTDHECAKIMKRYGGDSVRVVSEEPYLLIESIDGFAFKRVDKIALKAGIKVGSQARTMACIVYVLNDSQENGGNIWLNGWELTGIVTSMLLEGARKARVPLLGLPTKEEVRKQVHFLRAEGLVIIEGKKVYGRRLHEAETVILGALCD